MKDKEGADEKEFKPKASKVSGSVPFLFSVPFLSGLMSLSHLRWSKASQMLTIWLGRNDRWMN